jgi:Phytochelatin synthase.
LTVIFRFRSNTTRNPTLPSVGSRRSLSRSIPYRSIQGVNGKGAWRWFSEDLLDCCASLDEVRARGVDLDEFACLARCNGAEVQVYRADVAGLNEWREALSTAASGEAVVVASYDRAVLRQTGSGHYSPIGGYHRSGDLALILDVARFKYPPHWAPAELIWKAMGSIDQASGLGRGWVILRRGDAVDPAKFETCC